MGDMKERAISVASEERTSVGRRLFSLCPKAPAKRVWREEQGKKTKAAEIAGLRSTALLSFLVVPGHRNEVSYE